MHGVPNYESAQAEVVQDGANIWVKCYNGTGSAIANGKVVKVIPRVDTAGTPDSGGFAVAAVATNSTGATDTIGVVDNWLLGKSAGIANAEFGFVCIRGEVEAYGGATVAAGQFVEVLNAEDEFKDAGVASTGVRPLEGVGICVDALADGTITTVFLLGVQSQTKAS